MNPAEIVEYRKACVARDEAQSQIVNFHDAQTQGRRLAISMNTTAAISVYNALDEDVFLSTGSDYTCSDSNGNITVPSGQYFNGSEYLSQYVCASSTTYDNDWDYAAYHHWSGGSLKGYDDDVIFGVIGLGYDDTLELDLESDSFAEFDVNHMDLAFQSGIYYVSADIYLCADGAYLGELSQSGGVDAYYTVGTSDDDEAADLDASDGDSIEFALYDNDGCSGTAVASTTLHVNYYSIAVCSIKSSDPTSSSISDIDAFQCTEVAEMTEDDACYFFDYYNDDAYETGTCTNDDGSFYCCRSMYGYSSCYDGMDNTCIDDDDYDAVKKAVKDAANTLLTIIIVCVVLSLLGGIICCCACIKGCPLYEKCCCAPKGEMQSQTEFTGVPNKPPA